MSQLKATKGWPAADHGQGRRHLNQRHIDQLELWLWDQHFIYRRLNQREHLAHCEQQPAEERQVFC
jgi:hypothetical protein